MPLTDHPLIVTDPGVCHGKPVIKGTRVPVFVVVGAVAGGDAIEQVASDYGVSPIEVRAAIAYVNDVAQNETQRPFRAKAS